MALKDVVIVIIVVLKKMVNVFNIYVKKNYYSLKCENKCNKNCINGCDLYNGFCINCQDKYYFGKKCEMKSDKDCLIKILMKMIELIDFMLKVIKLKKKFSIVIENYKDDNDFDDFENYYLNLSFGSMKKEINILIDFNSNSP